MTRVRLAPHLSLLAALLFAAVPASLRAQDKSLHWKSVAVEAHLDSAGVLRVRETQAMVFTGDWNGGERRFNVRTGQRFELDGLVRVDSATGRDVTMTGGDNSVVDGFDWGASRTLRWRSRLPEDPPFVNAVRTYRLEYSYSNILVPTDDSYRLDHDFAFADREGPIEAYTLKVTLDKAWRAPAGFTGEFGPLRLEPGFGFTVDIPLQYVGVGRPAGVIFGADFTSRAALAGAFAVVLLLMAARFIQRERSLGRFAPSVPTDVVNEDWLRRTVLGYRPEVVGAAWDETTGAAEVTAVLARLEQEGKLKSRVENQKIWVFSRSVLHMSLRVDRDELRDYERALVDGLFFGGRKETDTDAIRKHYSSSGFTPSSKIEGTVKQLVDSMVRDDAAAPAPSGRPTAALIIGAIALYAITGTTRSGDMPLATIGVIASAIWYLVAMLPQARLWRDRVEGAAAHSLRFFVPMAILAGAFLTIVVQGRFRAGILVLATLAVLIVAL